MRTAVNVKIPDLGKRLDRLKAKIQKNMPLACKEAGQVLLARSLQLVPRDTTVLAESGQVRDGENTPTRVSVKVGYGWADSPDRVRFSQSEGRDVKRNARNYAYFVHENLIAITRDGTKTKYPVKPPGQPDYLRQPINESQTLAQMSKAIHEVMEK